jgi:hypothetical protein
MKGYMRGGCDILLNILYFFPASKLRRIWYRYFRNFSLFYRSADELNDEKQEMRNNK